MAQLVGALDSGNRYADIGDGLFHFVADPDTAASLGLDWNVVTWYGDDASLPGSIGDPIPDVDAAPAAPPAPDASNFNTGEQYITPDGSVYTWDQSSGTWRHIPDVATANAMGLNWNTLVQTDSPPQPLGADWPDVTSAPPTPAPAPVTVTAASTAPADSFVWGGITWTAGELTQFVGYLAAHGSDYTSWANNHPDAAAIFQNDTYPGGEEPVPKSVGEALGMAIANGATPAEAAAIAAPLAQAQAAQGFGAPTGDQLLQAATDVANAYQASGGAPEATPAPAATGTEPTRGLLSVETPTIATTTAYKPKGVITNWHDLIKFWKTTVPKQQTDVSSKADSLKGIFG